MPGRHRDPLGGPGPRDYGRGLVLVGTVAALLGGVGAAAFALSHRPSHPASGPALTHLAASSTRTPEVLAPTRVVTRATGSPTPSPSPAAPSPTPTPNVAPKLALEVLNASSVTGLADRASRTFRAGGWPVSRVSGVRGSVTVSTVFYDPGHELAARSLAAQFPGLKAVALRPSWLATTGGLIVVLTRDYQP